MKQSSLWVCIKYFHVAKLKIGLGVLICGFLTTYADDTVLYHKEKSTTLEYNWKPNTVIYCIHFFKSVQIVWMLHILLKLYFYVQ